MLGPSELQLIGQGTVWILVCAAAIFLIWAARQR